MARRVASWRPPEAELATANLAAALTDFLSAILAESGSAPPTTDAAMNGGQIGPAFDRETAARYLGIGTSKLWQLTRDGRVPSVHIGDRHLWRRSDLDAFLAGLQSGGDQ